MASYTTISYSLARKSSLMTEPYIIAHCLERMKQDGENCIAHSDCILFFSDGGPELIMRVA